MMMIRKKLFWIRSIFGTFGIVIIIIKLLMSYRRFRDVPFQGFASSHSEIAAKIEEAVIIIAIIIINLLIIKISFDTINNAIFLLRRIFYCYQPYQYDSS